MPSSQPDTYAIQTLAAPDGATISFVPHGGQVTAWTPASGRERLFLSPLARFSAGEAIRGGVPVCWPQFSGRGPLPSHGFARRQAWSVISARVDESTGTATAHMQLLPGELTRAMWDNDFQLDLRVTVGGQKLSVQLAATNTGPREFAFTTALHTYFAVDDIRAVTVGGLQGLAYEQFGEAYRQPDTDVRFAEEVDRIYWNVPGAVTLNEGSHTLTITGEGFPDVVVWNPWAETGAAIADMPPESYQQMVCIEAAVIGQPVTLAPGASWIGTQHIEAR